MSGTPRILVTGASGFIGRWCLPRLRGHGFDVHAISRTPPRESADAVTWHATDLLRSGAARTLIAEVRPTHLLHAAWIATPGVFWDSPDNLRWLATGLELVDAFGANGGVRAVGVGSCAEYDWSDGLMSEERTALNPKTIYGQCKLAMSLALAAAGRIHGFSTAWARLFFPYGPGESEERLISTVIRALLKGEVVETTHGRQERDFVFVDDVADALARLVTSDVEGPFNIGSGRALALRDVVRHITDRLGGADRIRFGARPADPDEPPVLAADTAHMRAAVGWEPATTLADGIAKTIETWRAGTGKINGGGA